MSLASRFILWAKRRTKYATPIIDHEGKRVMRRFPFLWPDEWKGKHRPPAWRPFNILLHWWYPMAVQPEPFHDHPRWSITICLRGRIVEASPWGERTLTPGSIVIRSRKAIHRFWIPKGYKGKTWTLFIVGRRNHKQNYYHIIPY